MSNDEIRRRFHAGQMAVLDGCLFGDDAKIVSVVNDPGGHMVFVTSCGATWRVHWSRLEPLAVLLSMEDQ